MRAYSRLIVCFLATLPFFPTLFAANLQSQDPLLTPSTSESPQIRNATVSDVLNLASIILAAFKDLPHTRYVYQFMDDHPADTFECVRTATSGALSDSRVLAQLAFLSDIDPPHSQIPIAAAVWEKPELNNKDDCSRRSRSSYSPFHYLTNTNFQPDKSCMRVLNITRAIDWDHQFSMAAKKHLDEIYLAKNQLYLGTLGTLPNYQRHGAGAALVRSGIDFGNHAYGGPEDNVTATLIATIPGEPLYAHLGWESLHNFTIKSLDIVDGKREEWRFDVMKFELS